MRKQPGKPPDSEADGAGQRVYQALRQSILSMEFPPNMDIEEARLVAQFKVSRTPVREALIRLSSEGLIVLSPNRGGRVAALSMQDVIDHQEAMDLFEPAICALAAWRRTSDDMAAIRQALARYRAAVKRNSLRDMIQENYEFHRVVCSASHNESLKRAYQQIIIDKLRIAQHGALRLADDGIKSLQQSFASAGDIYERLTRAIEARNKNAAWKIGAEHSNFVRQQLVEVISTRLPADLIAKPSLAQ